MTHRVARRGPCVAVVDNYDSFTYNLVHYLAELGARPEVHRNDAVTPGDLAGYDRLVVSPGPCSPAEAGVSLDAVRALSGRLPILGVCLGHQCVVAAFGGRVVRTRPLHGKTSAIHHDDSGVLAGLPRPFTATRYHSLAADPAAIPAELRVTASADDGTVMAVRHRDHPTYGVQFHPESVLSPDGRRIVANFLQEDSDA
ncbi:anthranilate synthase/aminodeoxychorismate synthase-like glutamine amidotransferase [Nocardiopsis mwathae]|uniref:Anthranilate synthase/aminodeoxychorismate synthase-like glutamine amidotransferase n=1 Tax=Nocardiopsis mwathae TaxID=1472723 RepID=A0A7W9YLU7_9ACTN|nr:aminodeoxychorismate/anthranilate synthase component II [Nocardiopsis mwathae]MBB6174552.1 anthranilate synthase/aminodeoxychorismate synthase-like glutamine amidotransferase [Nocardiopsis mwathae]